MDDSQVSAKYNLAVGVVLLNWNGGELTISCIRSLLAGTVKPDYIVVVDNASDDGSPDYIADIFPQVTLIRNSTNKGFTGGNHQGVEFLLNQGVDYIWLLNNDTLVAQDCLDILIRVILKYPEAAGASGKIFYNNPKDRLWYAGAVRHPIHRAPKHLTTSVLDAQVVDGAVDVEFISGCCMFIASWAFKRFGGFVTSYIAYSEDSEWCWRVKKRGAELVYVPDAQLWHILSASLKKNTGVGQNNCITPYARYLMNRNHLWTVRMHAGGRGSKLGSLTVNIMIQLRNMISLLVEGEYGVFPLSLRGLVEGLFVSVPDDIAYWN